MEDQTNKKTIFLSHSSKDFSISKELYDLLMQFIIDMDLENKFDVFYSPESLKENNEHRKGYRNAIYNALSRSFSLIVLWTPNSTINKWVNYEVGVANAINKMIEEKIIKDKKQIEIVSVRTDVTEHSAIVNNNQQILSLNIRKDIVIMLKDTFGINYEIIDKWAKENKILISSLINTASQKCIYFVGGNKENKIREWNSERVQFFVTQIVESLIDENFSLASFPEVPDVGVKVAEIASKRHANYEIAGLYKFDESLTEQVKSWGCNIDEWNSRIVEFRKIYLRNKHCMVIIGGSDNTREECNVALDNGIQLFPLPCFGGFGKKLFDNLKENGMLSAFEHPCIECTEIKWSNNCSKINKFIERFKKYKNHY